MKKLNLCIVSATALILVISVTGLGNIVQAYTEEYGDDQEQDDIQHHYSEHQLAATLKIFMYFDKDPDYYGDAVVIANGHEKKLDFNKLANKYISPLWIKYYYYGYQPEIDEVCLKNLDSGKKNCVDVPKNNQEVDINMPD